MKRQRQGFTLIELAVVLLIIGLLTAVGIRPLLIGMEQADRRTLKETFTHIDEVLIGYAIVHGRLPCPDCDSTKSGACTAADVGDGVEDRLNNTCKAGSGKYRDAYLPWTTLGITGFDPWGRHLRYQVQENYADSIAGTGETSCHITPEISFQLCSQPGIKIVDHSLSATDCKNTAKPAIKTPAVVYSEGKHAAPDTLSCHEQENIDGDWIFADRGYSMNLETYYDDLLLWLSPYHFTARMVAAKVLP